MIYFVHFLFLLLHIIMFVAIVFLIYNISKDAMNLSKKYRPELTMDTANNIKSETIFACVLSFMLGIMITVSFIFNNITII
jgi:hypothetical protein